MNSAATSTQFLLLGDAARELGIKATALRKAARARRVDTGALYELVEWTRVAASANLI
ncbi:hypothetical protein SEA_WILLIAMSTRONG_30 [Microbacterium phage WilliamStrong]|nr:hypothetical protein SEA_WILLIAMSTRONG_30 [Microbacterium phage WilliamStrong]